MQGPKQTRRKKEKKKREGGEGAGESQKESLPFRRKKDPLQNRFQCPCCSSCHTHDKAKQMETWFTLKPHGTKSYEYSDNSTEKTMFMTAKRRSTNLQVFKLKIARVIKPISILMLVFIGTMVRKANLRMSSGNGTQNLSHQQKAPHKHMPLLVAKRPLSIASDNITRLYASGDHIVAVAVYSSE